MTKEDVKKIIDRILVEEFEVEASARTPQAKLGENLGLDSLDAVDLVVSIERKFGFRMDEQQARQMRALADIYAYVDGHPSVVAKEVAQ